MYVLKRGVAKAEIYSLSFSMNSSMLGVSSDRGTFHIFDLRKTSKKLVLQGKLHSYFSIF